MRSAIEIANWFIRHGADCQMTHLKIQKLLYFTFGYHAAKFNEHLFYDPIEAWRYGPVVQSVYHHLSFSGDSVIDEPIVTRDGEVPFVSDDELNAIDTLQLVLRDLGHRTARELVEWTHAKNGPWDKTRDERQRGYKEIDKGLIRRYFAECAHFPEQPALRAV